MFKNYIIVAFRNILRYKGYSFINILGLAIGMAACLLILYFVNYEKSYDRFQENSDRIYRLRYERTDQDGQSVRFASCCPPAGLRIRQSYPEVEKVARLFRYRASVSHSENKFIEERMYFAESDFFEIFKYKFIEGDPLSGIKEPNTAFISRSTANKYFGDKNPVGQTISVDKKVDYKITGVFEDIPGNVHLKFDIMLSYPSLINLYGQDVENSWGDSGWFTYLLFKPQTDMSAFEKKLPGIVDTEFSEALKQYNLTCEFPLQALNDIHLTSQFMQEHEVNGNKDTVKFLSVIAVFIIIIAWVNYINLSTARSLTRAKEVGLRKVVGAVRSQLMVQLFSETVMINLAAILSAFLLTALFLPVFRQITGTPVEYSIWAQQWFWITVALMFLIGVFLSGLYPVIVLSSFKPVAVLRGKTGNSPHGINLRKVLVGFQFLMALVMLICTYAVFRQITFMKNQDPGFSMDEKIIIRAPRVRDTTYTGKLSVFKEQLLKSPGIINFCATTDVPGRQSWWDAGGICRVGTEDNKNYQIIGIDYDFANVFNLKFAGGRNFGKEFPSDSTALILNETAVKWLGFKSPEDAIGQQVLYWGKIFTVAGVLKDYRQQSLKHAFEPHIFRFMPYGRDVRGLYALTINGKETKSVIQDIRTRYDEFFPGNPFEYFFLDEYFDRQYKSDEMFGKVFGIFSILAIFVTSLGILGLSSFMVLQRTKEIGIRKVLGAGIWNILLLFTKDFQWLLLISFIIACPVSYFGVKYWLESFAVRMDISAWLFIIPLLIVSLITSLTICLHVITAALANPVESLRSE